jgi:protein O-mannosyl-transferase
MNNPLKFLSTPKGFSFVLLIACWLVYGNTLHKQFMIDDHTIYTEAELGGKNIFRYFIPETQQPSGPGEINKPASTYRPLTKMFWALTYRAFGADPAGYHVFNIFVFWLTCVVLFFFIIAFTQRPFLAASATLIFCVHPYQGLMMNNLPTILVSIEMLLMLLAMILYKRSLTQSAGRYACYGLSFVVAFAAFLIHETAVAFPIYLVCALVYGLRYTWPQALKASAPFFIMSATYFIFRMKFASLKTGLWDQAMFFQLTWPEYLATFTKLIGWYAAKLVSPSGIVLFWTTPIVRDNPWIYIAGLAVLLVIGALIFRAAKDLPIIRWGLAWLVIGFLPVMLACLFRLSEGLCLESLWLVFPSIGYFLIMGYVFDQLWERRRRTAIAMLVILVLFLTASSRIYNRIWSDERTYNFYALDTAPTYRSGYFWLGNAFMREGNYILARTYLPQGLSSKVYNRQIYNNLGLMDFFEEKWKGAEENFLRAIQENPGHSLAYGFLGRIYLQQGDIVRAQAILRKALEINPKDTIARLELAAIEEKQGQREKALAYYEDNLRIAPHDGDTLLALLRFYLKINDRRKVADTSGELLQYNRDSAILTMAAENLAANKHVPLAFKTFEKALRANPKDKEIYLEFGKLLGNLERFDDAIGVWQEGSRLDPKDRRFGTLIGQAEALRTKLKK